MSKSKPFEVTVDRTKDVGIFPRIRGFFVYRKLIKATWLKTINRSRRTVPDFVTGEVECSIQRMESFFLIATRFSRYFLSLLLNKSFATKLYFIDYPYFTMSKSQRYHFVKLHVLDAECHLLSKIAFQLSHHLGDSQNLTNIDLPIDNLSDSTSCILPFPSHWFTLDGVFTLSLLARYKDILSLGATRSRFPCSGSIIEWLLVVFDHNSRFRSTAKGVLTMLVKRSNRARLLRWDSEKVQILLLKNCVFSRRFYK